MSECRWAADWKGSHLKLFCLLGPRGDYERHGCRFEMPLLRCIRGDVDPTAKNAV